MSASATSRIHFFILYYRNSLLLARLSSCEIQLRTKVRKGFFHKARLKSLFFIASITNGGECPHFEQIASLPTGHTFFFPSGPRQIINSLKGQLSVTLLQFFDIIKSRTLFVGRIKFPYSLFNNLISFIILSLNLKSIHKSSIAFDLVGE